MLILHYIKLRAVFLTAPADHDATVQAVREAHTGRMIARDNYEGIKGNTSYALPHDAVMRLLKNYGAVK